MKGSDRYVETVVADREGRDKREGQDKERRTFGSERCERKSWTLAAV